MFGEPNISSINFETGSCSCPLSFSPYKRNSMHYSTYSNLSLPTPSHPTQPNPTQSTTTTSSSSAESSSLDPESPKTTSIYHSLSADLSSPMEESGENWPSYQLTDINTNLEKAIDYVSYLEERVRELEKQNNKTSGGATEGSGACNDIDGASSSCCDSSMEEWCESALPEVKARVSEKEVLIIIHCEKQKSLMQKILSQLEILHLSVISSSVLPFGKSTLDITIVAQMGKEFNTTVSDIVRSLRRAISK